MLFENNTHNLSLSLENITVFFHSAYYHDSLTAALTKISNEILTLQISMSSGHLFALVMLFYTT